MNQGSFLDRLRIPGVATPALDSQAIPPRPKLSRRELADRFCQELEAVGGVVRRAGSLDEAGAQIVATLRALPARRIATTRNPIFDELELERALFEQGVEYRVCDLEEHSREDIREAVFSAEAGLTAVDYGVAETGSLVLLTRPAEGRAVSLVPPVHVGVLRSRDIVFELGELFETVISHGHELPSALTFVTGPSSTADIELVHTVGVHGPRELHLVLLD